jgi:hypothetical protein
VERQDREGVTLREFTTVLAQDRAPLVATFDRSKLVPGVYSATVQVQPEGRGDPLAQAVTFDSRSGPFTAFFAILIPSRL